jgi:hypothetical protein
MHAVPAPMPAPDNEPLDSFREWRRAVDAAAALRDAMKGRHVQYVGMFHNKTGPIGRIKDVTSAGFKVQWDGTTTCEWIDPDGVVFINP